MNINEKTYLSEVQNRINFYGVLSHESPEVQMEHFKVLKHSDTPKQHFLHLKYYLLDKEDKTVVISVHEEIETFIRAREKSKRGWLCVFNQNDPEKIKKFLEKTKDANDVNIEGVKIKEHDIKAEV